jgi:hypothetical protein
MNVTLDMVLIYAGFPILVSMGTFLVRNLLQRIDSLEEKMSHTTTESQVRQLVLDKFEPLAQDIKDIKEMQQKCLDMNIQALKDAKKTDK